MRDIESPADVPQFVDAFYGKVRQDAELSYLFDDVAQLDWPHHLPKMYAFWTTLIFGEAGGYKGNPMRPHLELGQKTPIRPEHFQRWLTLFYATIDELFTGEVAEQTKIRARSIATVIESRLYQNGLLADTKAI